MGPQLVPLGRGRFFERSDRPGLMAIINVTPDSFSDGGECAGVAAAVARARAAVENHAVIVDVGGESTRPNAAAVDAEEEERRVVPAVRAIVERVGVPVSVDTRRAAVFCAAWRAGASMLNDVSGLRADSAMAAEAARTDAAVLVMHMRGTPADMDAHAQYSDVLGEVRSELGACLEAAQAAGIQRQHLLADPGLGFAKDTAQNVALLRRIGELLDLGVPLVLGPSRKRFLGALTGRGQPQERDHATTALIACLAAAPVALWRVHAPGPAADALAVAAALRGQL